MYRIGIVGCGNISRMHAQNWTQLANTVLVAGCDIKEEAVNRLGDQYGFTRRYLDYRDMFEQEALDVVSVCTWPGSHAEISIAAARAGVKGILCEKPMCRDLAEADTMIRVAEEEGAVLAIGHKMRFSPMNVAAREWIRKGAVGRPITIWAATRDGLANNGCHYLDWMRYVLDDPAPAWVIGQVERRTDRYERKERIEDLCFGLIGFANGTRGLLECDLPEAGLEGQYLQGSEGSLWFHKGKLLIGHRSWEEVPLRPEVTQFQELLTWMEGGPEHRACARQIRPTVEMMMAIYQSVRGRGLVKLPLEVEHSPLEAMIDEGMLPIEKPGKYDIRLPD